MGKPIRWAILAVVLAGVSAARALADEVVMINTYGATPFLYGGYTYVPLRSASDFIGAGLLWDSLHNRATLTYHGHELGLVVGSPTAYYAGRPIVLPAPPVLVGRQVLVPATVFDSHLGVPVRWDEGNGRALIQGPRGWGYYAPAPHPPAYVVTFLRGHGPPPWAPAHGRRRKERYYSTAYASPAFVYSGVTYVPLRDVASLIGAALLWDSLRGRAALTYGGQEFGLVVGSPTVFYGAEAILLPAPPIIAANKVFVPVSFCERHLKLEARHGGGVVKFKAAKGERDFRVASRPPGRVTYGKAKPVRSGPTAERGRKARKEREQSAPWGKSGGRGGPQARQRGGTASAEPPGLSKLQAKGPPGSAREKSGRGGGGRGRGEGREKHRGQGQGRGKD